MLNRAQVSLFLVAALVPGCAPTASPAPIVASAGTVAAPTVPYVAHRDGRSDSPTFIWLDRKAPGHPSAREAALAALQQVAPRFGLSDRALATVQLVGMSDGGTGPIIARFEQRIGGAEVLHAGLRVAISRAFVPVAVSGLLARSIEVASAPSLLGPREAIKAAHELLLGQAPQLASAGRAGGYERFFAPTLSRPARSKQVLFLVGGKRLEPAHYLELVTKSGPAEAMVISARDGRVLLRGPLRRADAYTYRAFASQDTLLPYDGPQGNGAEPHPTGLVDGFRPSWGDGELVQLSNYPFSRNDPWLPSGSSETRGNNVDAYSDVAEQNGYTGGTADTRGQVLTEALFDYSYDHVVQPGGSTNNTQAAIVNLFYVNNFLHDWFYDAGFDEAAGNHQLDNLGRGGSADDPLLAEALDYSGRNNANALVPADGDSPQMQMFIFSGTSSSELRVDTPASLVGWNTVGIAGFGKDAFLLNGSVVLANDDTGVDTGDACEPLINETELTGKIALVHRGLCSFVQKAQNAQNAGAVGVVLSNIATSSNPSVPPYMGGTDLNVTIPVLSLGLADGLALEAALGEGVTVQMKRSLLIDLDGALDNSIIAHEWGHILSGRLVGDGSGLFNNQASGLGEGWSDFVSLLLQVRADDQQVPGNETWQGVYPTGAYASSGGGTEYYFGIRRVPYSVDFAKNAYTFKHIQNGVPLPVVPTSYGEDGAFNAEVHATGEVWATMLWECYVGLLRDPRYSFEAAQERMKRYLVAGLKMTPIEPTLLEARDALLAATLAVDEHDFEIFWQAFARRGAGVGATGPSKESSDNIGVTESFVAAGYLQVVEVKLRDDLVSCDHDDFLDEGERGAVEITLRNAGTSALGLGRVVVRASVPEMIFDTDGVFSVPPLGPFDSVVVRAGVTLRGARTAQKAKIVVAVGDLASSPSYISELRIASQAQTDEAAEASAIDRVDTRNSAWEVFGINGPAWSQVQEGEERWWFVPNSAYPSQHELESPAFKIEGTTFTLKYRHRWSFRRSQRRMTDLDGGVVEISTDDGDSWNDVSDFGAIDYNTSLDTRNPVLGGRAAYGSMNDGYPDEWVHSSVNIELPEHPESVRVRFQMGTTGGFSGAPGWEIDDIELVGASSTPFYANLTQRDLCDEAAPTVTARARDRAHPGETVALEGQGTNASASELHYDWVQEEGPYARIASSGAAVTHFIAPKVEVPTALTFALRAHDGKLLGAPARVTVMIEPSSGCAMGGGQPSAVSLVMGAMVLLITRRRARRR